jgi:hypothetical protein
VLALPLGVSAKQSVHYFVPSEVWATLFQEYNNALLPIQLYSSDNITGLFRSYANNNKILEGVVVGFPKLANSQKY